MSADSAAAPAPGSTGFGSRLAAAMDARGPLCVGIDPHPQLLAHWGLDNGTSGVREFSLRALEAVGPHVAAVKPQAAFFERLGSAGPALLAEVVQAARSAGVLCIVDAKRGDIGSTMAAYAQAFLGDDSDLAGDAVTLSPFLGYDSLAPALDLAGRTGRGVFVLALTSNPAGATIQHARAEDGRTVAATIAAHAARSNATEVAAGAPLGSVGLVVGATVANAPEITGTDLAAVRGPLLAPGLGAQGASAAELPGTFADAIPAVLATASRSVLGAGPDPAAMARTARALAGELAEVTGR
ncbi:orotidine-5'-phosphate decarboxylase [Pseudactinotalea sp. Z1739]|uniref:orotidine-5'-phosphate decarboxylase n=1 Tax=Pseudactinotalea sp. Z1739 TaxID=3413028 RepID=UPI003C7EB4F5